MKIPSATRATNFLHVAVATRHDKSVILIGNGFTIIIITDILGRK